MRLGSVLSEALRNIGSGVSRAFAMFLAVLLSGTLLGGYEAMTVIDLESQAVQRINAYADVNAIVGGTVDGTACDRLSDAGDGMTGTLAGAMRAGKQVVPLATPGKDISSYDVTPGMIRLIAGNAKADVSGVWVPRDVAKDSGSPWAAHCGHAKAPHVWLVCSTGRTMGVTRVSPTRSSCRCRRALRRLTNAGSSSGRLMGRRRICCMPRWWRVPARRMRV